jgi:hypothetical protein
LSRGLGRTQRRLLTTIAAATADGSPGVSLIYLRVLWSDLDGKRPTAYDRANLHRGARTLVQRGLITQTEHHADETPRCRRCGHHQDQHEDYGWCQAPHPRISTGTAAPGSLCECSQYRPSPSLPPWWLVAVTEAGRALVSPDDMAPYVAIDQARTQKHKALVAEIQAYRRR